jgi:hypothetical protein
MLALYRTHSIADLTVYEDDSNPSLFYVMPDQPGFRIDPQTTKPVLKLIKYVLPVNRPDGSKGGGFLIFDSYFVISDAKRNTLQSALNDLLKQRGIKGSTGAPAVAQFGAPTFTKGTASLTLLDSGGALVTKIHTTSKPSLLGSLICAFTAELSPEGVAVVEGAMEGSGGMGQIRTQFPDVSDPRLAPVPFDEGTVQIVTLDLQGSGGTSASPGGPGTFQAVQNILGASTPELFGDNNALFGLKLTEAGASILEAAFEDGMAPVGGIYNLKFTGVLPSLDIKITADLKRVYDSFSVGLEAKVYWVSAGIDATFEKLRQDGDIKVEVVNLSTSTSVADKEQWALNLFKDQILSQWFTPSLSPTTAQAANVTMPSTAGAAGAKPPAPAATTAGAPKPAGAGQMQAPPATATATPASSGMKAPATSTGMKAPASATPVAAAATAASGSSGTTTTPTPAPAPPTPAQPATTTTPAATTPTPAPAGTTPSPTPAPATPAPGAPAKPLQQAAGTAAAASSAASPFGVSLQLKYVSQEELKTVEIEYNRMDAVQRTYAPQGYFGLAPQGLDKSKHFLKVDGTDPFFTRFVVTCNPPKDFAGIGLLTAHAALDYGDPNGSEPPKHGEFLFDASNATTQTWPVFEGNIQETSYTYTTDYKFDPESGWVGEQTAYTRPTVKTDNRLLNLDPYDSLRFVNVAVSPNRINADLVDRIDVMLQCTTQSGWQTSNTITVRSDSKPQNWKLRLEKDSAAAAVKPDAAPQKQESPLYTYSTICYLKDGTQFARGPYTGSGNAILVSDPFAAGLDLLFQPAFDPTAVKLAIVELQYADSDNGYSYQTSFEILGSVVTPTKIHLPLLNPKMNQYQYRVTLLGPTGQRTQGSYIAASDPLVLVTV